MSIVAAVLARSSQCRPNIRPLSLPWRGFASSSSFSFGGGLFSRISSFLAGAGLTALGTQLYLFDEVRQGNRLMLDKQKDLELRLLKLEKKK